jgi:gliding motility-associated lipoprotein GldD
MSQSGYSKRFSNPPFWGGLLVFTIGVASLTLQSCKHVYYPKPTAYPRIEYPAANYITESLQEGSVHFERPTFTTLKKISSNKKGEFWYNLEFPDYNATLYLSLLSTDKEKLPQLIFEKESIVYKQAPSNNAVSKQEFEPADKRFLSYYYETKDNSSAPIQFIVSNKTNQLFLGTLTFNYPYNSDSIADILIGMDTNIKHLIETFYFEP